MAAPSNRLSCLWFSLVFSVLCGPGWIDAKGIETGYAQKNWVTWESSVLTRSEQDPV